MAETTYLGNSIEIRQYPVSIGYTNLQIRQILDENTVWRGFKNMSFPVSGFANFALKEGRYV